MIEIMSKDSCHIWTASTYLTSGTFHSMVSRCTPSVINSCSLISWGFLPAMSMLVRCFSLMDLGRS